MKIGIFTECYRPTINGVVISIETFREGLEKAGYEVLIFAPYHPGAKPEKNIFRFPSFSFPKEKYYPVAIPFLPLHLKYLPKKVANLDIIHSQHISPMGKLALWISRRFHKPIVHTYHTLLVEYSHYIPFVQSWVKAYLVWISKNFCNQCDQIITPSPSTGRILASYGVKKPIVSLPTGIDLEDFKKVDSETIKKKFKIDQKDKILLYVGRLAKEKNIDFLIDVFIKIFLEFPKIHLVLVGGGSEEKHYQKRIKQIGLSHKVTFTGFLEKKKTNQIFGAADLFLFPSQTDTQGIVIVEAMASGTIPVAVNRLGPADIITNGVDGYLAEPEILDFSQKVLKLLDDDKLRMKFSSQAKKTVQKFSKERTVKRLIEIYQNLIKK